MRSPGDLLYERLLAQSNTFHKVLDFDPSKEKLINTLNVMNLLSIKSNLYIIANSKI